MGRINFFKQFLESKSSIESEYPGIEIKEKKLSINWGCAKKFKFDKTIPENKKTLTVTMKRKPKPQENKTTTFQLDSTEIDMG